MEASPQVQLRHEESHSKARVWDLIRQWLVTLSGAALAIVAVAWFQPWDLVLAVKDQIIGAFSVAYLCVFASGVLVGSFFIPVIMAHAPHMFMDIAQTDRQAWRRQAEVASSHNYVPIWAEKGAMGGVVWTAPGSRWGDADTLVGPWPPPTQGKHAKFLKWTVFVRDGFLVMRQDNRNDARANADGLHRSVPVDARVPLAGAHVDLLPEATQDKSPWLRKAPMKIIFPGARDPYAEDSFILFAATSAEKEQWHLALTWAAHFFEPAPVAPGMHTQGLQAQDLYARFSSYVRGTSPVILPMQLNQEHPPPPASNSIAPGPGALAADAGRPSNNNNNNNRGWFGRIIRRRPRPPAANAAGGGQRKTQVVGDFIQDKQWGGQPSQQGKQGIKSQDSGGRGCKGGVLTAARTPTSSNLAQLATMPPLQQVNSAGHIEPQSPISASASGYAVHFPPGDGESAEATGDVIGASGDMHAQQSFMSPADHNSPLTRVNSQNFNADAGSMPGNTEHRADASQAGNSIPAALHVGHGVGQLAGLHAVNMFLARGGFDLLRSQKFYDNLRQRLTIRLANIVVPNYITPLRLDGMELGTTVPMIKSAHALPSPSKTLVPRLVVDIVYHGSFKLIIQTSINMKESPADFSTAFDATAGSSMDIADDPVPLQDTSPPELASAELDAAALDVLQQGFDTLTGTAADAPSTSKNGRTDASASASTSAAAPESVADSKTGKKPGFAARVYRSTKNMMTGSVKRVVDSIVESVARTSVTLEVVFTQVEGPIMVWLAPPPSNRMWVSFLQPPKIRVTAKPLNVNAMVQYTAMGVKLSSWLEGKLKQSLSKNMVFPACTDIKLPFLLDEEDLATIAMPLDLPAVPVERTSSPGPLSGAHRASNSSLSSIDLPQDGSNGGDKANKAAQAKAQRPKSKKERGKNNSQKASPGQKSADSAVAAAVSTVGPRLTDVTSASVRRPFMRVFTHAIPRILRRGGAQQAITASAIPPLLTAPPSESADALFPSQQSPATINLPAGRSITGSFSRRSTTNASSVSEPSLTERTSSSNLLHTPASAPTLATAVVSQETGTTSPLSVTAGEHSLDTAPAVEQSAEAPVVATADQDCVEPGNADIELHPASSSALSVSPSSLLLSPDVQSGPKVHENAPDCQASSPDLLVGRATAAQDTLSSASMDDALISPQAVPRRSLTDSEAQLACTYVACIGAAPALRAVPDNGQDAVFISDVLPGPADSTETSPSRKSPGRDDSETAAVQHLVSNVFAGVLQEAGVLQRMSTAGSDSRALCSSPEVHASSSSVLSPGASIDHSTDGTPDLSVRPDRTPAQPASSASPLQSRESSWRTPIGVLLNAHLAEGSSTNMSAASESGTEAVSTTGTPSEYPSEGPDGSPILHAHSEQAALLQLHMMGKKKKKLKAGSYVIGDDGSVTRGKRPPAK